jgi:hypothetical protein
MSGDRTGRTLHRKSASRTAQEIIRNGRHWTMITVSDGRA